MNIVDQVDKALSEIPETWASAVRLVHMEGCTLRHAARLLGVDHKTVKARAQRGLNALRDKGITGDLPTTQVRQAEHLRSKLVVNDDGCWIYTGGPRGGKRGNRYGNYWMDGENRYAHRAAYELFVGQIPDDGFIHHKCSNRLCCNPDHLQCTTWEANLAEMLSRRALLKRINELESQLASCVCERCTT